MFQSNILKVYSSYENQQDVFLINIVPNKVLDDKAPHEALYGEEPKLNMIKIFGCLCYLSNVNPHKIKLDQRANKAVFIRYKQGMKGYIPLDLHFKFI